ncbi:unnamed protein product [Caenorhabditis brenneri]
MRLHSTYLLNFLAVLVFQSDAFNTRVKRHAPVTFQKSTRQQSIIHFDFLGQEYVVDLEPNHAAFHQTFKVFTQDGPQYIPREEYIGTVREPKPGKGVFTQLEDNVYIGVIYFDNDTLHLEPAYPHGLSKDVGAIVGYFGSDVESNLDLSKQPVRNGVSLRRENPFLKYKRSIKFSFSWSSSLDNEVKNRCTLKLVADYSFYSIFGKNNTGIVTKFLVNMVARVNEIYTPINWDINRENEIGDRGRFHNMGFSIKEIKVLDRPHQSDSHYNSYNRKWKSSDLLDEFAIAEGSKEFCLVHLVTARTFIDVKTLGLAWPSYPNWDSTAGGICSELQLINGKAAYLNAVLTSAFMNKDQSTYPMITKEIDMVVAHEYGHAWGANHDPLINSTDPDVALCSPTDREGGKYLMYEVASSGYERNNVLFSPCSITQIQRVLKTKWDKCFQEEMTSFCGNGIVEGREECDNGVDMDEQGVSCCDKYCLLHVGAQCSPLNHICCTPNCQFHNSSHVCLYGDPLLCKADAVCDGVSGECPPAPSVKDGQGCFEDGECSNGKCLPYCEKKSIGKKSCICEDLDLSCRKCCRDSNGTCSPVPDFKYLRDGVRCSKGICRQKQCVNEVIDNVRVYFSTSFRSLKSTDGFLKTFKSHIVLFTAVIISLFFVPAYLIVWCNEKEVSGYQKVERDIQMRQVYVYNEDRI